MAARYGTRRTSQYTGGDMLEGRATAELAVAVRRGDGWPPSSTEFRAMCLGIPTFGELRYETLHPELPRTPFGVKGFEYVDPFALRQAFASEADRMRRQAYELTKQFVLAGNVLPEVPAQLRKPEPVPKRFANEEKVVEHTRGVMVTIERLEAEDAAKAAEQRRNAGHPLGCDRQPNQPSEA